MMTSSTDPLTAAPLGQSRTDDRRTQSQFTQKPTLRESTPGDPTRRLPRLATVDIPVDLSLALPTEVTPPNEAYARREPAQRDEVLLQMGGNSATEDAVSLALRWLAAHQSDDGHWDGQDFDARCGHCDGQTDYDVNVALTGLSLLCFLGAGHTQIEAGPYQDNVQRALDWLLKQQRPDGDLRRGETMYSQGIATLALSEAYGMTSDPLLGDGVHRAVDFIVQARNRVTGGWRYEPGDPGDTSVLGWQIMALKSADLAGVPVPAEAFASAKRWLVSVESPRYPGLYAYQPGQRPTPAMTAEGMFVQQLLGTPRDDPRMAASIEFLAHFLPDWERRLNTYYWYYSTLAHFHHHGAPWERWNERLQRELLANQVTVGPAAGSWPPGGEWAPIGGRVYQTAICTLMLEVYYRYLPLYSPDQPLQSAGMITGTVRDAETSEPLAGVTVQLDLVDHDQLEAVTDLAGHYELLVPRTPDFFAISASHSGFVPESRNVSADALEQIGVNVDFELRRRSDDALAIEAVPEVHHLGNDRFSGRMNSQFQKDSEGRIFVAEFELTEAHVASREVRLTLLAKGVQCPHRIYINGELLDARIDSAPRDGSFGEFSAPVEADLLQEGVNTLGDPRHTLQRRPGRLRVRQRAVPLRAVADCRASAAGHRRRATGGSNSGTITNAVRWTVSVEVAHAKGASLRVSERRSHIHRWAGGPPETAGWRAGCATPVQIG